MSQPQPPSVSAVEATHMVLPHDTNVHGTAFGGKIMQWMDIAAAVAAGRHCAGAVVTAAVDELAFSRPIRMGDVVIIRASVNFAARTSLEVGVRVEREIPRTRVLEHCLSGYFTFVGVDSGGLPMAVPQVAPQTEIEHRRFRAAERRRQRRVADRASS